jgi:uncharacterized membrane protein
MNMLLINALLLVIIFLSVIAYAMVGVKFENKTSQYSNYGLVTLGLGLALAIFSFSLEWYISDKIHKAQMQTMEQVSAHIKTELEWTRAADARERSLTIAALKKDLQRYYDSSFN